MEETISLKEIFDVVKKRLLLIISFTLGVALIAAVVSFFVITPIYQSSTQFIVNQSQQSEGDFDINSGTIRTNIELINTYTEIIRNRVILDEVIETLDLPYSVGSLAKDIQVANAQNSQVVNVTVKNPDPELATKISNEVVEVFQKKIVGIMNVDNVSILSPAVTSDNPRPVDPNPKLNIAIGFVLGLMVGVGIAFLLEYLDTSVRTEEDIEDKLGVTLLGVVSTMNTEDVRANHSLQQNQQKRSGR